MFYKKIKKSIIALAIATSITSATVVAESASTAKLTAKTVKTDSGEITSYTDKAGKLFKKVTVTVKGNVTITETIVYDAAGKIVSKVTVAELKTEGKNPKLIRKEVLIENADGSTSSEITNITPDGNGGTTTQTTVTTTDPAGNSTTTTTTQGGDDSDGTAPTSDDGITPPSEGDDAGSIVTDGYANTSDS